MYIQTKRLVLRELDEGDAGALGAVLCDAETMAHYPAPFDAEGVLRWIRRNRENYRVFGFGLWAAVLRESGELIGDCGVTMQTINGGVKPEIGYHIRRDLWRRGLATEAAAACRDFVFERTPFNAVYSYMRSENLPSRRVAEKLNMSLADEYTDGEGRDICVYEVTRSSFRKGAEGADARFLRPAAERDAARIAEIIVFNNRVNYRPIFGDDGYSFGDMQTPTVMRDYMAGAGRIENITVYDDGVVKGFMWLSDGELKKLYVDTFFQSEGIGAALLERAGDAARFVWVLEKNYGARRFYERFGFRPTGERMREEDTIEYLIKLER